MHRAQLIQRLIDTPKFDVLVIGGGATGLGIALDASLRGLSVVLLESHDFAKGTSSRATKLVHGGVRYLAQGNIGLVREALHERSSLLENAPHLTSALPFVVPGYKWWEAPFYGAGLMAYDLLAGKASLGRTEFISRSSVLAMLPNARSEGLKGGVKYWDGQFDDARLALALAKTAASQGALVLNYFPVIDLLHEGETLVGVTCRDHETQREYKVQAGCVINAAGVWVDDIRQMEAKGQMQTVKSMVSPSQGVHLVVDRHFLDTNHALMVPKTADGRVLFAVPWMGKTILGTTDTPRQDIPREPKPFANEVAFILEEAARYLKRAPNVADVRSIWVGMRPLVKPQDDEGASTKSISREHTVVVARSGLVTVTGGKWTTYRAMAEDVLARCHEARLLPSNRASQTGHFSLVGAMDRQTGAPSLSDEPGLHLYGSEAAALSDLPGADTELAPGLTEAMVRFAVRAEMARTVEDVLARRSRILFMDAARARSLGPRVAKILREEGIAQPQSAEFEELALQFCEVPGI